MKSKLIIYIFLSILCISCEGRKEDTQAVILKGFDPYKQGKDGKYQLWCRNFPHLDYLKKMYAWHLYNACFSGQDIVINQAQLDSEDTLIKIYKRPPESTINSIGEVITELEGAAGFAPASSASSIIDFIRCLNDVCEGFPIDPLKVYTGSDDAPVNFIFRLERLVPDTGITKFTFNGMVLIKDEAGDSLLAAYEGVNARSYQLLYSTKGDVHIPIGVKIKCDNNDKYYICSNVLETYSTAERHSLLENFLKGGDIENHSPKHFFIIPELHQIRNRMAGVKDVIIVYRRIEE
ncbi:hypothetical protein K9N50_08375 [bacterium]|nr:hypothetical protein [bacterium]